MKTQNLTEAFSRLDEFWAPKIIARVNDVEIKIARLKGEFDWHAHADTDEMFLVKSGRLIIHYREGSVELGPDDLHVVPRGVEHKPEAPSACEIVLMEAGGTLNTGQITSDKTRLADDWT